MKAPIRVAVCDDSTLMRALLREALQAEGDIEVVAMAADPYEARAQIKDTAPDVLTLDIEMPRMDGVAFLEKIMKLRPMPVVMVSTLAEAGADVTLAALELGAVDAIRKPHGTRDADFERFAADLRAKVRAAAAIHPRRVPGERARAPQTPRGSAAAPAGALLAVGASTGGVEALRQFLTALPPRMPPIAIVQHMPPEFTARFAERLDHVTSHRVREAQHGLRLAFGDCVIAPGGRHLEIVREQGAYVCRLEDGPTESGHRPSVDVLFRSAAQAAGRRAVGVILTGMGRDGAAGLLEMRKAGAATFGQNEESALIYGMPRAARECGAVQREASLEDLPLAVLDAFAAKLDAAHMPAT